jgi:hypothetical protein
MYVSQHQPLDWNEISRFDNTFRPSTSELALAKAWLSSRVTGEDEVNEFSQHFDDLSSSREEPIGERRGRHVVFFTSSQDEFWELGELWPKSDWKDQYEAFSSVVTESLKAGSHAFIVRMHPNTLNKSPQYMTSELRSIYRLKQKYPEIKVIWPHETRNSYQLAADSQLVVVWNSTIGVEAMFLGCEVMHLEQSFYALASKTTIATTENVASFFEPHDVSARNRQIAVLSVAAQISRAQIPIEKVKGTGKVNKLQSLFMARSFWAIYLNVNYLFWRLLSKGVYRLANLIIR